MKKYSPPRKQPEPKIDYPICPDNLPILINWHELVVGASVFIPALNLHKLKRQMLQESDKRGIRLVGKERIEGGKLGMRFWRVV